jgi:hypothetical protein
MIRCKKSLVVGKFLSIFLFSLIFSVLSTPALALNINAYVVVDQGEHLLIDRDTSMSYRIHPSNAGVQKSLFKLKTFDSLRGQVLSKENEVLDLQAIDFVSLRRLLGEWRAGTTQVTFMNDSRLQIVTKDRSTLFSYALSPGSKDAWRLYMTDHASVVLGELKVKDSQIHLEFYDSQTGEVTQMWDLSKVSER